MLQHLMQVLFDEQINLAVILQTLSRKHLTEVFYTGAAQKRAIVRAFFFFFLEPIQSRLEECLHKGGGHLEDIMFKK